MRKVFLLGLLLALAAASWLLAWALSPATEPALDRTTTALSADLFANQPLLFHPNLGQANEAVRFEARARNYTLVLTDEEAVLALRCGPPRQQEAWQNAAEPTKTALLRMRLRGAGSAAELVGQELQCTRHASFKGNDPSRWVKEIPSFAKVLAKGVLPGVDVVYRDGGGRLQYDLHLAPGTEPDELRLSFSGHERLEVDDDGSLVLHTAAGPVVQPLPYAYQEEGGEKRQVACAYVLDGNDSVGFQMGAFDRNRELVIDPVLAYSRLMGGSAYDGANRMALDSAGNLYVAGSTYSTDFFFAPGNLDQTFGPVGNGQELDTFIAIFSPEGACSHIALIGGTGYDNPGQIIVNPEGTKLFLCGATQSADFPTTPGALSAAYAGGMDTFLMEFGIATLPWNLDYSTYFGGPNQEAVQSMVLHTDGSIYLAGFAYPGMPTTPGAYQTINSTQRSKIFVNKFAPNAGSYSLGYSTYIGSGCSYYGDLGAHLAVDPLGDAWITGQTSCRGDTPYFFPTTPDAWIGPPARPKKFDRHDNVFLTRIRPAGADEDDLIYSTFLSTKFTWYNGCPGAIAIDSDDPDDYRVFVVSRAVAEYGFWNTPNAYSNTFNYANAGNIARCDAHLMALDQNHNIAYGSFFGGFGSEEPHGLAVHGNLVYMSGWHAWSDPDPAETAPVRPFPVTGDTFKAVQTGVHPDSSDGFLSVLEIGTTATELRFSTLIGGALVASAGPVLVDGSGDIYLCGYTRTPDFMTTHGDIFRGTNDAWALRILDPLTNVFLSPTSLSATASVPFQIDLAWTDNTGDETGFAVERSEDGLFFSQIDTATSPNYPDSGLTANTKYYYRVRAFKSGGWSGHSNIASAVALGDTPTTDHGAGADQPVSGTLTGTYVDTWAAGGASQTIQEILSGGLPKNQYSYLEHRWVFNFVTPVAPANLALHLKAAATDLGNYGETFQFSWSPNGSTFTNLFLVNKDTNYDSLSAPLGTSTTPLSTIYIRVIDTNRAKGKKELNTISVDHMFLRQE